MKKLFRQEKAEIKDNPSVIEIKDIISKGFDYPLPTPFQKVIMQTWFSTVTMISAIFFLILTIGSFYWSIPGFFVLWGILLAASIVFWGIGRATRGKYRGIVRQLVAGKQKEIYELWFSKNYDDVKIEDGIDVSRISVLAHANRGAGIPGDAVVTKFTPGYRITSKNGAIIDTSTITWKWTRSNGRSSTTYYRKRVYMTVVGYKANFNDFNIALGKNGLFDKKRKELENETFNKEWVYNHNDPVLLRMLFTPSVQEEFLKWIKNSSFEINKTGKEFLISQQIDQFDTTFIMNTRGHVDYSEKEKIVENFTMDALSDIANFQNWLMQVAVLRTLFRVV